MSLQCHFPNLSLERDKVEYEESEVPGENIARVSQITEKAPNPTKDTLERYEKEHYCGVDGQRLVVLSVLVRWEARMGKKTRRRRTWLPLYKSIPALGWYREIDT